MKPEEFLDQVVPTEVAAALIGGTPHWLRKLHKDFSAFEPVARGKWRVGDVLSGYHRYLENRADRLTKASASNDAQKARAEEIRRRMAREDREIIALSEAVEATDMMGGEYLRSILGLPARISREPHERQRIEKICDLERGRLSTRFSEISITLRTGITDYEAIGEDDAG